MPLPAPVLQLNGITHSYRFGNNQLAVLRDVKLELEAGKIVSLVAPSGTGKSTLLSIAGLLERPNQGTIQICGQSAPTASAAAELRAHYIGFVYQFHHLIFELNTVQNVAVPLFLRGIAKSEAHKRAAEALRSVQLEKNVLQSPHTLSGGQQQRVAIARALVSRPKLILADEPTGNLDPNTADLVFGLFLQLTRTQNAAALIVTHNMDLARQTDAILTLRNHELVPL